jgi:hypothetical protein
MKKLLYALTFAIGLCLVLPGAASGRGALGSPAPPPPEKTKEEIQAEKDADYFSFYFLGSLASLIATTCVVQFFREVRGSGYSGPRFFTYSARTDQYDEVEEADDDHDTYDSRYETDF